MTVALVVADGKVTGTVSGAKGTGIVEPATVSPDGTAKLAYGKGFSATVKFSGSGFTGNFASYCGSRAVTGSRMP
jgi:hypothetical protein